MISRRTLITAGAAFGALPIAGFAADPVSGKDYIRVNPAVPMPATPLLVHDFFAYTCPHCLTFEPAMTKFKKSLAGRKDVKVIPVPIAWNQNYEVFPRVFYAFEALDLLDKHHLPFWEWVIKEDHSNWKDQQEALKDILVFLKNRGVDSVLFERTMQSFAVTGKVQQATKTWKNYGVDSTPSIGIGGKYITAPHLTGTRTKAIEVANFLIRRELRG